VNTTVAEVGPDIYKLTTYIPEIALQFSQFVLKDDEPVLIHTGMKALFPLVKDAVAKVIPPSSVRWIAFSHFEADECGSLNEWLALAPKAQAACSFVGAMVSVNDFASRPARALQNDEVLVTGKRRVRFLATPHVPHCWEAGLFFEETDKTLFSTDLFGQSGDVEARSTADVVLGRAQTQLVEMEKTPFANYFPYTPYTASTLERVAKLAPKRIATMHGSTFEGDGARAIRDLAGGLREVLGPR
jgi:flavorubredoxin